MKHMKKMLALALVVMSVLAIATSALAGSTIVDQVNVRSGPSTSYGRIGSRIPLGSIFNIMFQCYGSTVSGSTSTIWYYVEEITPNGGGSGYPSEGYIHSSCVSGSPSTSRPSTQGEAFGGANLRLGSKGPEVYNVQLVLYTNDYLDSLSDCDGLFGSGTRAAVMDFQAWNDLDDDGIVGPYTMSSLWAWRENVLQAYGVKCY